ncbi:MAG: hypothetical protein ACPKPY_11500 [Nitrososphaeraceae archaeon]
MNDVNECMDCCNKTFSSPFDLSQVSHYKFHMGHKCNIIAVYAINNKISLTISYDCGVTFTDPIEIMNIDEKIVTIQIASGFSQYVVAIMETKGNKNIKKAVSGFLPSDKSVENNVSQTNLPKSEFSYKQCETFVPQEDENLIDVSLGFRPLKDGKPGEVESVDYVFINRPNDQVLIKCFGHGCIIKE